MSGFHFRNPGFTGNLIPPIIYTAATGGATLEYDSGGKRYRSHTFTSNGTFTVTTAGNGDRNKVDYLIIAGGGGGGTGNISNDCGGGGAGAGGYLTTLGPTSGAVANQPKFTVQSQNYGVTVGGGGIGATPSNRGATGVNSSVFNIASNGGGGGAGRDTGGGDGGSGGGQSCAIANGGQLGFGTSGQGFNGGGGVGTPSGATSGGGGAGQVGFTNSNTFSGAGGNGLNNLLRTGSNETRAGGGGGGSGNFTNRQGAGGAGGGGAGGNRENGVNGTANTGGGGGGAGGFANSARRGGNGGSGIVVIRYEIAPN